MTVTARSHPGGVDLVVADNGCGIPEAMMAKIFEPFQRADSMVTREVEGSGLGLSISRHFMEMHGGRLLIESRVGAGTVVTARFPAERAVVALLPEAAPDTPRAEVASPILLVAFGTLFAASD